MELIFGHEKCAQRIVFTAEVVEHFRRHVQRSGPEVGGQLFGTMANYSDVIVKLATGPRSEDKKSRFLFIPSRDQEKREIGAQFRKGLHYLGDWHTHPEESPSPSSIDLKSMKDCFAKSRHQHRSFTMVIIGNGVSSDWMYVSLHDGKSHIKLKPMASTAEETIR